MWKREQNRRLKAKDEKTKTEEIERGIQLKRYGRKAGQMLEKRWTAKRRDP